MPYRISKDKRLKIQKIANFYIKKLSLWIINKWWNLYVISYKTFNFYPTNMQPIFYITFILQFVLQLTLQFASYKKSAKGNTISLFYITNEKEYAIKIRLKMAKRFY